MDAQAVQLVGRRRTATQAGASQLDTDAGAFRESARQTQAGIDFFQSEIGTPAS
jgi:hypothetical protein